MATASHVNIKNKTGKAATDLHITLRGSGGKLQVDPGSVKPKDGGRPPRVPSNEDDWPARNEVVIEWDRAKVEKDDDAEFDVATEWGELQFDSGYWTGGADHKENIGEIKKEHVQITPKKDKSRSASDRARQAAQEQILNFDRDLYDIVFYDSTGWWENHDQVNCSPGGHLRARADFVSTRKNSAGAFELPALDLAWHLESLDQRGRSVFVGGNSIFSSRSLVSVDDFDATTGHGSLSLAIPLVSRGYLPLFPGRNRLTIYLGTPGQLCPCPLEPVVSWLHRFQPIAIEGIVPKATLTLSASTLERGSELVVTVTCAEPSERPRIFRIAVAPPSWAESPLGYRTPALSYPSRAVIDAGKTETTFNVTCGGALDEKEVVVFAFDEQVLRQAQGGIDELPGEDVTESDEYKGLLPPGVKIKKHTAGGSEYLYISLPVKLWDLDVRPPFDPNKPETGGLKSTTRYAAYCKSPAKPDPPFEKFILEYPCENVARFVPDETMALIKPYECSFSLTDTCLVTPVQMQATLYRSSSEILACETKFVVEHMRYEVVSWRLRVTWTSLHRQAPVMVLTCI
jgi:hypothetical protein